MKNSTPVTASTVRAFFAADEKRLNRLPEKARKSIVGATDKGPRGQIHPLAIKAYNKGRKPERQYVTGVGVKAKAEAATLRAAVVAAGGGTRGPIAKDVLAQVKG